MVSREKPAAYYTKVFPGSNNREEYLVYGLVSIPRKRVEEDIRDFERMIQARYENLLHDQERVTASVRVYEQVLGELDKNLTLPRIVSRKLVKERPRRNLLG
ncbi:MAG: hypothetical protein LBT14_05655 [Treponema sp.]|jgi:hypothetical protein|nr:hypothetical protein [Treponema sp.]